MFANELKPSYLATLKVIRKEEAIPAITPKPHSDSIKPHTENILKSIRLSNITGTFISQVFYLGKIIEHLDSLTPNQAFNLANQNLSISQILPEYFSSLASPIVRHANKTLCQNACANFSCLNRSDFSRFFFKKGLRIIPRKIHYDNYKFNKIYKLSINANGVNSTFNTMRYYFRKEWKETTSNLSADQKIALNLLIGLVVETMNTDTKISPGSIRKFISQLLDAANDIENSPDDTIYYAKCGLYALKISTWINCNSPKNDGNKNISPSNEDSGFIPFKELKVAKQVALTAKR